MTSFWALFSCNNNPKNEIFKPQSTQDTARKTVKQVIFGEEVVFNYSDFYDLKNNKNYDRFLAGELIVNSGKIVCADPLIRELALPQSWKINKGKYSVYLYIGLDGDFSGRVAYAQFVVKDEIPTYWELSLIPENHLNDSLEKQMNGMYPVDAGLSCFADYETFQNYEKEFNNFYLKDSNANFYDDVLKSHFQKNKNTPKSSRGEDWINFTPNNSKGNIIMFGSGYGDGLYPRYVGYDDNGNVICFVTDFIQINQDNEEE